MDDFTEYDPIITLGGFFAAVYVGGAAVSKLRITPLLGEIAAGVILGPEVLKVLSSGQETSLQLVGNIGVTFMIFESGMHINFEKLKVVVWKSLLVAILAVLFPIGSSVLFVYLVYGGGTNEGSDPTFNSSSTLCEGSSCYEDTHQSVFPDGLALGFVLAPTSVAISSKILTEAKALGSFLGQTIKIATAFIEDIFSIVAIVVLANLAKGDASPLVFILPLIYSTTFVVVGGAVGFILFPKVFRKIEEVTKLPYDTLRYVQVLLMMCVLAVYCFIGSLIGSHLLGAFVAGMSFSRVPRSHQVWVNQMKKISKWLIRIFFGSTVAFSIPISEMLTVNSFLLGIACAAGPCILAKLLAGLAVENGHRFVVGAGMAPRAEFAFLIAEIAMTTDYETGRQPYGKMLSSELYSVSLWALLFATVISPFIFQYALGRHARIKAEALAKEGNDSVFSFKLKVKGLYVPFIVHDVISSLKELSLHADNVKLETDEHTFILSTIVRTGTMELQDGLDDEAFETIKHHIFEVINDEEGIIIMTPIVQKKAVQIGELKFWDGGGHEVSLKNAKASNVGGDWPSGSQQPEGVLTSNVELRWADRNQQPLMIRFPDTVVIKSYSFATAKDFANNAIEPTSWTLEGLLSTRPDAGDSGWTVIDEVDDFPTPTGRNELLPKFTLEHEGCFNSVKFVPRELPHVAEVAPDELSKGQKAYKPGVHHTSDDSGQTHFVVVKVMGEHNTQLIVDIYQILALLKLDIHKAKMYQAHSAGCIHPLNVKTLYCKDLTTFGGMAGKERLTDIRIKLSDQFKVRGISGKAMVSTTRIENAPAIYGYTPAVPEGTHVGEFVFVYKHPRIKRNTEVWCPLTAVLEWMNSELQFDIINLAMDTDPSSNNDHVTIFVKDPAIDMHDQDSVLKDLAGLFEAKEVACYVSAHLHVAGRGNVVTELGEEKAYSPNSPSRPTFAHISDTKTAFSFRCYHGESIGLDMVDLTGSYHESVNGHTTRPNNNGQQMSLRQLGTFRAQDPSAFKMAMNTIRKQVNAHINEAEEKFFTQHGEAQNNSRKSVSADPDE
eukprot:TRINITY_DN5714_c0_g2_i1.p1 TRINITY_DN5714_c0_g2~~TRINITY_DN5714_c0_g2_i1.p1  ORF type:complete len:1059 (+),score=269.48 TRINITY_DN5714_c0_g2_i1:40-3216(+)